MTTSVVTGSYVDPKAGAITFADYFEEWSARQVWAPGTVKAMELAAGSVPFGGLPMRAIRPSHIEAWIKTMTVVELAPGTIRTRYNNVRGVFRGVRRDKVIGSDPCEGITLPRQRRPEVAMRIPTPETVGKIMAAAEPWFAPLVGLCAFAGLRLGEAAGVKLDDIDFLRRPSRCPAGAAGRRRQRRHPAAQVRLRAGGVPGRRAGGDAVANTSAR